MEPSDRELMLALARGDGEALALLMERHHRRLFRIALSYLRDAEEAVDSVQETFVKAYRGAPRWDPSSEVGPWLTRIAVNEAIDRYRRLSRRRRTEEPLDTTAGDHDGRWAAGAVSAERRVMGLEVGQKIGAAVRSLPERQRAVFLLRHHEQMSLEEIARVLDMSLGTVKSSLHRAIRRLRERLRGIQP